MAYSSLAKKAVPRGTDDRRFQLLLSPEQDLEPMPRTARTMAMISGQTQLLPWLDVPQDRVHHQETAAIALTFALNERAAVLTPMAMALALL